MIFILVVLLTVNAFANTGALTVQDAVGFLVGLNTMIGDELTFHLNSASIKFDDRTIQYAEVKPVVGLVCENVKGGGYYQHRVALKIKQTNAACNFLEGVASKYLTRLGSDLTAGQILRMTSHPVHVDHFSVVYGHVKAMFPRACKNAEDDGEGMEHTDTNAGTSPITFACSVLKSEAILALETVGRLLQDPKNFLRNVLNGRLVPRGDGSFIMYAQSNVMITDICEKALFRNIVEGPARNPRLVKGACFEMFQKTVQTLVETGTLISVNGSSDSDIYKSVSGYSSNDAPITFDQARPFVANICGKIGKKEKHEAFMLNMNNLLNAVNYEFAIKACDYVLMSHMELLGTK